MTDLLYRWPAAAKFGSRVPKEKFYGRATGTKGVRERFVSEIQRITWSHKLAEATINLPGSPTVPEIQVFQLDAKGTDIADAVLTAIDRAIPYPIVFEITRGERGGRLIRTVAAHKQLGTGKPKLGAYYSTGWQPEDAQRTALPAAITLPDLYTALLNPLAPAPARAGESVSEVADRLKTVGKLEREIAALQRKLRTEPQLNRKIGLRRTLKTKQAELTALR